MKLYRGFDFNRLKAIASKANNKQIKRDVGYAQMLHYHNPEKTYCEIIDDKAFIIAQYQQGLNTQSSMHRSKFVGMTMADYMRYLWNNPQNGQSPYKLFEGALVPAGKDCHGNIIYKFNGARF